MYTSSLEIKNLETQRFFRILNPIKMKTYIFYSRRDKAKEAIGTINALDRLDAVEKFSEIKKLDIGEFTKMFEVEEKGR